MNWLKRLSDLAGLKVELAQRTEQISFDGRPVVIVTHESPDTDAEVCITLLLQRVLPKASAQYPDGYPWSVKLARSGEQVLPEDAGNCILFHVDTGLRYEPPYYFDQHALKSKERTASAKLIADYFRLNKDVGVRALVDLAVRTDNIEEMAWDSTHHFLSGLQHNPMLKDEQGEPMWGDIIRLANLALSSMYLHVNHLVGSRVRYRRFCERNPNEGMYKLHPSEVKVCSLPRKPGCRDEAWRKGADVALWSVVPDKTKPEKFWVGIGAGRKSEVSLKPVISALRAAEAKKRGVSIPRMALEHIGTLPELPTWFLYSQDGERFPLILAGSRSHPLEGDEFTHLTFSEIKQIVIEVLSRRPGLLSFFAKTKTEHLPAPKAQVDEVGAEEAGEDADDDGEPKATNKPTERKIRLVSG